MRDLRVVLLAAASVAAAPASASVVLEFDGILQTVNDASEAQFDLDDPFTDEIQVEYKENGFTVDLTVPFLDVSEQVDGTLGLHPDGGGAGNRNTLAVIRDDRGRPFSLDSFVYNQIASNLRGYYPDVDKSLSLQWNALEILGRKTDGSVVTRSISPWEGTGENDSSLRSGIFPDLGVWFEGNEPSIGTTINLDPVFNNLASVELRFNDFMGLGLDFSRDFDALLCSPVNLARVGSTCPDGSFIGEGGRNDSGYVDIESITISPVPLPASASLLLLAIGASAAYRYGSKRVRRANK